MKPIWVVADTRVPAQSRVSELVRAARKIRALFPGEGAASGEIRLILTGDHPLDLARVAARETGLDVTALDLPGTASWDTLKQGLLALASEEKPAMMLFAHTTMAREVGPALALALGGVSVSNVTAVNARGAEWCFHRPVLDNTRVQTVKVPQGTCSVLTLAPGAVIPGKEGEMPKPDHPGIVSMAEGPAPAGSALVRTALTTRQGSGDTGLAAAPIVVAAGRGIGEKENLEMVKAFTACFPKAAFAASRPLVDQGWVPYERQVGITGATVAPELYIAIGISGSSQHLAGMAGSKWVVSINPSPEAPMCRNADLCIQADALAFMAAVVEASGAEKENKK